MRLCIGLRPFSTRRLLPMRRGTKASTKMSRTDSTATETTFAFAEAVAALEGRHKSVVTSPGTAAIGLGLMARVKARDHVLIADTVYGATRRDQYLRRLGVGVFYFDPVDVEQFPAHLRRNTAAVYPESPVSHTFEIIDVPRITMLARAAGAHADRQYLGDPVALAAPETRNRHLDPVRHEILFGTFRSSARNAHGGLRGNL